MRAALKRATPPGVEVHLTGRDAIFKSQGADQGPGVLTETLLGGAGALVVLILVFGTLAAVAMPIVVAITSILTTFLCVFGLTYITNVSIIVQFLVALVGLGVAIDYALLVVFRFREELTLHDTTEAALVETMTHAGRSVIVSGSTVAIGLLSMLVIPLPFIRSIGLGGMLIPAVSVLSSITLLPAMLAILGPRINRLRVMPRKFVDPHPPESGVWWRWSRLVMRRSGLVFAAGVAIVVLAAHSGVPDQPERRGAEERAREGRCARGPRRDRRRRGFPPGALLPVRDPRRARRDAAGAPDGRGEGRGRQGHRRRRRRRRRGGRATPGSSRRSATRTRTRATRRRRSRGLQHDVLPKLERSVGGGATLTLARRRPGRAATSSRPSTGSSRTSCSSS